MNPVPAKASVVIIGGGVMGASIAFHLAEAGIRNVVLLERDTLASGSTSRSAGGVRAQFSDPANIALGARSLAAFEHFRKRPGAEIDLRQVGYLFVHTQASDWAAAQIAVELQQQLGVASEVLTPLEARRRSPSLNIEDVLGATFHARDGYCSPEAVVLGYATRARELGAILRVGVVAEAIEVCGGEVVAIDTSAGVIATNTVICASGAWSAAIAATAGVRLPVTPVRRQIVVTDALSEADAALFGSTTPMTIDARSTLYFHREGPGLLIGMSYAKEQPGFLTEYSSEWLSELIDAMSVRAPRMLELNLAYQWAGLYETTPDHNALIGESNQVSRLLYATGFSGHGFLQAPAVGEVMRDLYLRQKPVVDVTAFDVARFSRGKPIQEHRIV
jgi:sarcosine oxidase, subunit beta